MAKSGRGFARSFDPSPATNIIVNALMSNKRNKDLLNREIALQEYKRQQAFQEEQRQSKLMKPLLTGKVFQIAAGHFPGQRNITPEERLTRELQLSPEGRAKYKDLRETTGDIEGYNRLGGLLGLDKPEITKEITPENQDRIKRTIAANQLMGVKPETTFKEVQGLIYPKVRNIVENPYSRTYIYDDGKQKTKSLPQEELNEKGLNPAYKPTWREVEIPGSIHKDRFGRYTQDVGFKDINADLWNTNKKGQIQIGKTKPIKITSTGTNGEKIFSKELNEHFKNYRKDINQRMKILQTSINPDTGLEFTEPEKQQYINKIGEISSNYSQEVKNTAPPSFLNWYKQIYNAGEVIKNRKQIQIKLLIGTN